jgi:hypothetical protein
MDSDAHPIRRGWLKQLVSYLDETTPVAGVWRDEMEAAIRPYVHPSCFCTTTHYLERNHLRLDSIPPDEKAVTYDTMSHLTDKTLDLGFNMYKLRRTNRNQIHRLMGGIYGDLVYHHAAGTRDLVGFWDEREFLDNSLLGKNRNVRDLGASLLFRHHDRYISWLKGRGSLIPFISQRPHCFIIGMQRSDTSCLAQSFARSRALRRKSVSSEIFDPRQDPGSTHLLRLLNQVLAANATNWPDPPDRIVLTEQQRNVMRDIASSLSSRRLYGIHGPEALLLMDHWLEVLGPEKISILGTFRHPSTAAESLASHDRMSEDRAYKLWLRYNGNLVRLHRTYGFPLFDFHFADTEACSRRICRLAVAMGLQPNIAGIREILAGYSTSSYSQYGRIPELCKDTYEYLQKNSWHPELNSHSFESLILQLLSTYDCNQNATSKKSPKLRTFSTRSLLAFLNQL